MIIRALITAAVLFTASGVARAQTGGIRVAPVLVSLTPERAIGSVRLNNGRTAPVSFEVDAYIWTQENGEDVLTPATSLIIAPAVFEIPANGEQTVRLGVRGADTTRETAYRIVLRELPTEQQNGVALGFALEMSLPVFVTPRSAHANLTSEIEGGRLILSNTGNSFAQIALMSGAQRLDAPRYLLAGASASIELPAPSAPVRLLQANASGQHNERTVHVGQSVQRVSVR